VGKINVKFPFSKEIVSLFSELSLTTMKKLLLTIILCTSLMSVWAAGDSTLVFVYPIRETIAPGVVRLTDKCLQQAAEMGADHIIIDMNTYGGVVESADSIRTRILSSKIPVWVFVNNQAVSAGALISVAAERIYMKPGSTMGSATVVDQSGEVMPDKYQSFMRAMMRATAESHGKKPVLDGSGDTVSWKWVRDPLIAEAMVDPSVTVEGLVDDTKVVNFTAEEAVTWRYCEGNPASIDELLVMAGIDNARIYEYTPTWIDKLMGFLSSPALQGILIMFIIGGIYFEIQSPGIGLALGVAVLAALIYFAPLYVEGVLAYWEVILFVVGIALIILEIFVTPGFGVLGILGIVGVVTGLTFALIDTDLARHIPSGAVSVGVILRPLGLVVISLTVGFILALWLGQKLLVGRSRLQSKLVLNTAMDSGEGFISHDFESDMVGKEGTTATELRPSGKVIIEGTRYQASGDNGLFIGKNRPVVVSRHEAGIIYCIEKQVK
jgi:membrane-bound serine protease (ClpP class)